MRTPLGVFGTQQRAQFLPHSGAVIADANEDHGLAVMPDQDEFAVVTEADERRGCARGAGGHDCPFNLDLLACARVLMLHALASNDQRSR